MIAAREALDGIAVDQYASPDPACRDLLIEDEVVEAAKGDRKELSRLSFRKENLFGR